MHRCGILLFVEFNNTHQHSSWFNSQINATESSQWTLFKFNSFNFQVNFKFNFQVQLSSRQLFNFKFNFRCAGLIQRRVPRENVIDRRSPVVWGELGLKELKPRQLYERLLRQSITGRCVWWCENESDAVVSSSDHRSRRERGGVTGVGRGAGHGWWLVSDRPRHATPPHTTPLATPHVSIVNVELYSVNCGLLSCFWKFLY